MEKKMNEFENIHEKTNNLVTETGKGQHLFHMKEILIVFLVWVLRKIWTILYIWET